MAGYKGIRELRSNLDCGVEKPSAGFCLGSICSRKDMSPTQQIIETNESAALKKHKCKTFSDHSSQLVLLVEEGRIYNYVNRGRSATSPMHQMIHCSNPRRTRLPQIKNIEPNPEFRNHKSQRRHGSHKTRASAGHPLRQSEIKSPATAARAIPSKQVYISRAQNGAHRMRDEYVYSGPRLCSAVDCS